MQKIYKIDAVHDILKRVIKTNLNPNKMVKLYKELQNAGYEDKNIDVEVIKEIYEEGDSIMITQEMFDALPDEVDRDKPDWIEIHKKHEAKQTIRYIFGDEPKLPITGTLEKFRTMRDFEQLVVKWHNAKDNNWNGTNVYFLENMGFEFKQPKVEVIPIAEASDDMLNDIDVVIKYLMENEGWSERACETYLKPIYRAMKVSGSVFYRP